MGRPIAFDAQGEAAVFRKLEPTPGGPNRLLDLPSPYWAWAEGQAGVGKPDEDTDGDGRSNALEYLLGTSPLERQTDPPWTFALPGFKDAVVIEFELPGVVPEGVDFGFEQSSDLVHWRALEPTETRHADGVLSAGFSEFLTGAPSSFMRMVIHVHP